MTFTSISQSPPPASTGVPSRAAKIASRPPAAGEIGRRLRREKK